MHIKNVSSSGFNRFLVEKSIEIVSRTLHITRNISIHPNEKVGILNETKQLSVSFFIGLKPDDNSISKMSVRVVSIDF
jgi:hypothetical protein